MAQWIEHGKLAELTLYAKNPRRRPDAQIAQLGFNAPLWIDARGNIMAGPGRRLRNELAPS